MKVILLQTVPKIGKRGEVKEVNDGYARNFLLPKSLAKIGTPQALVAWELHEKQTQIEKNIELSLLKKNLSELTDKVVTISTRVNEQGHLFKGISGSEILEELGRQHRIQLSPDALKLDKPLKSTGSHILPIEISGEKANLKVVIVAERN